MSEQAHHWSLAAAHYEEDFIDPYRSGGRNLLLAALEEEGIAFDLTPFGSTRKLNSLAP